MLAGGEPLLEARCPALLIEESYALLRHGPHQQQPGHGPWAAEDVRFGRDTLLITVHLLSDPMPVNHGEGGFPQREPRKDQSSGGRQQVGHAPMELGVSRREATCLPDRRPPFLVEGYHL